MKNVFTDKLEQLEAIYKAGATDFKVAGTLTDQQTEAWFNSVRNKSWFLKKISMQLREHLTGNAGFIESKSTGLTRSAEGTFATTGDQFSTRFSKYALNDVDLPGFIGYSVIDDNPTAGLLDKINSALDETQANSLQNLGINGTADDYSGSAFLHLAKGWRQFAVDQITADPTKLPLVSLADDDERFDDLDQLVLDMALDLPQERRVTAVFLCSDTNRLKRNRRLTQVADGNAQAIAIAAMSPETRNTIGFYPTLCPDFWPDDFFMLTDPQNLEIDMHKTVRRTIIEEPRKKGFDYMYSSRVDFVIVSTKDCVVAYAP